MPKELFDVIDGHAFDGDHCFLCGTRLHLGNRTEEHVFPRWLQDAYCLRDHTITLLNGTRIPYRSLVIPCCSTCNGTHLSQLENRIKTVVLDEAKTLDEIKDQDLNAWISKIYIGILWKELELQFDRRNPDKGPIFPKEAMENFRMVHFFMQSCRKNMIFHALGDGFPNSLLRVYCKIPRDIQDQFDYLDNLGGHTVAIRMGGKGVLAMFDGGLHNMIFPDFSDRLFDNKPLHKEQFKEIFAKITYKNLLSLRVPYYAFTQNQETDIYTVSVLAFDDLNKGASCLTIAAEDGPIMMVPILPDAALEGPAYGDWSQEEFAGVLSTYTGIPFERLFVPPDLVRTSLRDDNGNFLDIPVEIPA